MKTLLAVLILAASVPVRADDAPAAAAPADSAAPAAAAADASPAAAPADAAPAPVVKVEKLTLTSGIKERQPVDESATFPAGFPVYCWTKLSVSNGPASIKYVWTADGKPAGEYSVDVNDGSPRWWATKKAWAGAWKVEVLTDKGDSLASAEFTVTAAAPKAAEPAAAAAPAASSAPAAPPAADHAAPNTGGQ